MEEESKEEIGQDSLKCVKDVNTNPDRLNGEGKRDLAHDIIEEIAIEEIDKFIKFWGYLKK